jgi:hypothetical protein
MHRTILMIFCLLLGATAAMAADDGVRINGQLMTEEVLAQLYVAVGAPPGSEIPAGDYWYDAFSGLWGLQGQATSGQIMPGLPLGGMLKADASGKTGTAVFINGRELHQSEVESLRQLFGVVYQGRFWMNAMGVGGYEGGPAFFDIGAAIRQQQQQQQGDSNIRRGLFGNTGGDGETFYYFDSETGSSVMIGG